MAKRRSRGFLSLVPVVALCLVFLWLSWFFISGRFRRPALARSVLSKHRSREKVDRKMSAAVAAVSTEPLRGDADDVSALNLIASWLAQADNGPPQLSGASRYSAVIVAGSSVLATCDTAAAALASGAAPLAVLSGGWGHSTPLLRAALVRRFGSEAALDALLPQQPTLDAAGHSEASMMKALMLTLGASANSLATEDVSRNCGGNARESLRVLRERWGASGAAAAPLLLLQDPTMQRRTAASFERWQADAENAGSATGSVAIASHAVFVPSLELGGPAGNDELVFAAAVRARCEESWSIRRFVSLLLGEVPRLRDAPGGYGPKGSGFITSVHVPEDVEVAFARLTKRYGGLLRD